MELLEGVTYTTDEMIKFFNVSKATWKKKKEQLLLHFGSFYEYEVEYDKSDYRKRNYTITKKLFDYEPPLKKSVKRDNTYENKIIDVIENDNIQTAMNVSRLIKDDTEIKEMNHKDGTVYEYTRVRMRNMFGTKVGERGTRGYIIEKVWCRFDEEHNCYNTLPQKDIDNFYKIFESEKDTIKEEQLTALSDFTNGLITREELNEYIGHLNILSFRSARDTFKEKYGFYPIKVPVYELSAFENKEAAEIVA